MRSRDLRTSPVIDRERSSVVAFLKHRFQTLPTGDELSVRIAFESLLIALQCGAHAGWTDDGKPFVVQVGAAQ